MLVNSSEGDLLTIFAVLLNSESNLQLFWCFWEVIKLLDVH